MIILLAFVPLLAGVAIIAKAVLIGRAAARMPVGYARADQHSRSARWAFVGAGVAMLTSPVVMAIRLLAS